MREHLKTQINSEGTLKNARKEVDSMNIDVSKIAGYEEMTPEEKVKALEDYQFNDFSTEVDKLKQVVSKANSEASEWKKKYNAQLSEEELRKQEREEQFKTMQEKLERLETEKIISENTSKFLSLGYDGELAKATAIAYAKGDIDQVLANQRTFLEGQEKKMKIDIMSKTERPAGGGTPEGITKESILAIKDRKERQKAIADNIELFE